MALTKLAEHFVGCSKGWFAMPVRMEKSIPMLAYYCFFYHLHKRYLVEFLGVVDGLL